MITAETKEKLGKLLARHPVKLAYIFGSMATGKMGTKSDADIAVLLDDGLSREQRFDIRLTLMGELPKIFDRQTDVIVLNDTTSLFFKYIIVKEGKLVFEKNENAAIDFEPRLLSLYFDFAPFIDTYNRAYVQRNI